MEENPVHLSGDLMEDRVISRIASHISAGGKELSVSSQQAVNLAEASLGFEIPGLLKSIYLTVANGGFGPGYGIIGVTGGHSSNLGTLVGTFNEINKAANYLGIKWNPGLLPFCEWGDNIFSCVDCSSQKHLIFRSDECRTQQLNYNLANFFEIWLEGRDLFTVSSSMKKTAEITNPFTGKRTRVTSGK